MKRNSTAGGVSMHDLGRLIGRLRRALRTVLPRAWLLIAAPTGNEVRPRRATRARIEVDPNSPADSWVAWEVSRQSRPRG
jgi:hypothetical protein